MVNCAPFRMGSMSGTIRTSLPAPGDSSASAGEVRRGGERILVVDDEDVLRRLARAVLTRQGYVVIDAGGPEEALEIAQRESFDLVLADVMMPGMRGYEMVERLRPLQPGARVLYMSGFVDDLEAARDKVRPLLAKPFTPRELLLRIRQVLDGTDPE